MREVEETSDGAPPEAEATGQVSLFLMSENGGTELVMRYGLDGLGAVEALLGVFGTVEGNTFSCEGVQVASPDLKAQLGNLVSRYAGQVPRLHRVRKFVSDLPDDARFLLLPASPDSTVERLECERLLHRLNHPDHPVDGVADLFGPLLERYDVHNPRTDRPR